MKTTLKIVAAALAVLLIAAAGLVADANLRIARDEVLAADAGAPGRFVTVDGRRLHVATTGYNDSRGEFKAISQRRWIDVGAGIPAKPPVK